MRCDGYRPSPVRRSQAKVLYLATVPLRRPNVHISQRKLHPLVIPAQAGIQNPPWVALQMSGAGSGRASRIKRRTG